MLEVVAESSRGIAEETKLVAPGDLIVLGIYKASENAYLIGGCSEEDDGGEIRFVDRDVFDSVSEQPDLPTGFLMLTELLHTIGNCSEVKIRSQSGIDAGRLIIARHIPGHWN